ALRVAHPNARAVTAHRNGARAKPRAFGVGRSQLFDVSAAAAFDCAPLWPSLKFQQPVVLEEAYEGAGRIVVDFAHRSRPDRGSLRQQVIALEGVAIATLVKILAE